MSRRQSDIVESKRLDSWKEIAAFFGRDERTVKRWEKNRSLPIHRIPGNQRGGVFAYAGELNDWLNSAPAARESLDPPLNNSVITTFVEPILPSEREAEAPSLAPPKPAFAQSRRREFLTVACLVLLLILGFLVIRRFHAVRSMPIVASVSARAISAPDHKAVNFYLEGRYYWNRRTAQSLKRAAEMFTQAIAIDPTYAEAYAGLADTYNLLREYSNMPEAEAYPHAIAAAREAVELNDSLAEAHRALAFALFYWKWEIPEALEEYRKAIQLDPSNADAHHWYATSFLTLQRENEALPEIERARALSPASPSILADRALILYASGDREAGLSALKEMEQSEPDFLSPPRYLSHLYFGEGNFASYLIEAQRVASLSHDPQDMALATAAKQAWQAGGDRKMLEAMLGVQQKAFDEGHASGFRLADTYLHLGEKKEAIHYLQAAFAAHDASVFAVSQGRIADQLEGEPDFDRLRTEVLSYTNRKLEQPLPVPGPRNTSLR